MGIYYCLSFIEENQGKMIEKDKQANKPKKMRTRTANIILIISVVVIIISAFLIMCVISLISMGIIQSGTGNEDEETMDYVASSLVRKPLIVKASEDDSNNEEDENEEDFGENHTKVQMDDSDSKQ
jgi:flagellar basal body-associated protein FliL